MINIAEEELNVLLRHLKGLTVVLEKLEVEKKKHIEFMKGDGWGAKDLTKFEFRDINNK